MYENALLTASLLILNNLKIFANIICKSGKRVEYFVVFLMSFFWFLMNLNFSMSIICFFSKLCPLTSFYRAMSFSPFFGKNLLDFNFYLICYKYSSLFTYILILLMFFFLYPGILIVIKYGNFLFFMSFFIIACYYCFLFKNFNPSA